VLQELGHIATTVAAARSKTTRHNVNLAKIEDLTLCHIAAYWNDSVRLPLAPSPLIDPSLALTHVA
jgi:hypothetical protein